MTNPSHKTGEDRCYGSGWRVVPTLAKSGTFRHQDGIPCPGCPDCSPNPEHSCVYRDGACVICGKEAPDVEF